MSELTKQEILESIADRKKEMADIDSYISILEKKIKQYNKRKEELRSLNFLDYILLNELNNGTTN